MLTVCRLSRTAPHHLIAREQSCAYHAVPVVRLTVCRQNVQSCYLCSTDRDGQMHMRIVWGRILPGQWDGFEAAYKKASAMRGEVKG
jgi:hypothetical protein